MKIIESIISSIIRNTGINGITDSQRESLIVILKNEDFSIDEKIDLSMQELNLKGSLFRKDIYNAIEFYLEFI